MLVDYEAAWHALIEYIETKNGHGQRDLLAEMGRISVRHRVEEGLPEKALRLYGDEFFHAVTQDRPALEQPRVAAHEGTDEQPPREAETTVQRRTHASSRADSGGEAHRGGSRGREAAGVR